MIFLKKLAPAILSAVLVFPVLSVQNVQAHKIDVPPMDELSPLTPIDYEVSPRATIVELPGPIKYYVYVSNAKLKQMIDYNNNFERNLKLAQNLLGLATVYSATAPATIALDLTNSPLRRIEQAYYSGEGMYIGQYYPTPKPGLSTVPFRYYTKGPTLKFIHN